MAMKATSIAAGDVPAANSGADVHLEPTVDPANVMAFVYPAPRADRAAQTTNAVQVVVSTMNAQEAPLAFRASKATNA